MLSVWEADGRYAGARCVRRRFRRPGYDRNRAGLAYYYHNNTLDVNASRAMERCRNITTADILNRTHSDIALADYIIIAFPIRAGSSNFRAAEINDGAALFESGVVTKSVFRLS